MAQSNKWLIRFNHAASNEIAPQEVPLIQPIGCAGSDHSNVKPHGDRLTRGEPMLFIGGPLDGQMLRVPADGRLYDHHISFEESCRYIPSIISFDGKRRMVYILLQHIRPEEQARIAAEKRETGRVGQQRYIGGIEDYEMRG